MNFDICFFRLWVKQNGFCMVIIFIFFWRQYFKQFYWFSQATLYQKSHEDVTLRIHLLCPKWFFFAWEKISKNLVKMVKFAVNYTFIKLILVTNLITIWKVIVLKAWNVHHTSIPYFYILDKTFNKIWSIWAKIWLCIKND